MRQTRSYDKEYKVQAVKLAKEKGTKDTAAELGIPANTLSGWVHKAKNGRLDLGMRCAILISYSVFRDFSVKGITHLRGILRNH